MSKLGMSPLGQYRWWGRQWALGTLLGMTLLISPLFAQLQDGSISGIVTDPKDAVVAGAQVTLTDQLRGTIQTTTTNSEGFYIFPKVPAATYEVSVEVSGFKRFVRKSIVLQVNQNLTVPAPLELGTKTEEVTVTGVVSQIDTVKSTVQSTVDSTRMVELPLNGRDVLQLQALVNGAVYDGAVDQQANTPGYRINGGLAYSNNYTLDGGEHTDSFFNSPIPFPNPDALQEFTIQSSNYDAEYGRNRGAQINAVTKSGTNAFHGSVYEFARNTALDARNFFSPSRPPFNRNQFGATVGGPIKKNSSFFFFSWDALREAGTPNPLTFVSPTAAMRNGDFSALSTPLIDPTTGTQFEGNVIPSNRLSQPMVNFLDQYVPLPNTPEGLFSGPSASRNSWDNYMGRFDQRLTSNDQLSVRYLWSRNRSRANRGSTPTMYQDQIFGRQSLTVNETHTFGPSLVNTITGTFNRVNTDIGIVPHFNWAELGAPNFPETIPDQRGWITVNVAGYFYATNGVPWTVIRDTYNFHDTLLWIKGRHSLKFGGEASRYNTHQLFEYMSAGSISFGGGYTGNGAGDMMLGQTTRIRQASPGLDDLRQTLWGFFAQDDIKVTRRLTLNLGVRYDPYLGFRELHGMASTFSPGQQSARFPTAPSGLLYQGDPGVPSDFYNHDWTNLAPRVGFAWDVLGNQSVALRGSYGIFYDAVAGIRLNRFPLNQPFLLNYAVYGRPIDDPYLVGQGGTSPFPYYPPSTPEEAQNFEFVPQAGATGISTDSVTPYSQQWNLTIEKQLPGSFFLSAAYVGSESVHLFGTTNINPAIYAPGATPETTQDRRIYPWLGAIESAETVGNTHYHALQILVKKPYARGFTLTSAYTFSKNTGWNGPQAEGGIGTRNPLDRALDNGILDGDVTHLWSSSVVWNIPSPKQGRLRRLALGGWQTSVISQVQSGFPFTVRTGLDNSLSGQYLDTADLVGTPSYTSGSRGERMQKWFDTSAYALNAEGTFGTLGINTLRGPGRWNVDFGVLKNFSWAEQRYVQFRAEFFNVFNNVNLGMPDSYLTSGSFGAIYSAGDPRIIQFGLKLVF